MKILVTGGAGFIGSQVAKAYVELGHEVAIVDNLSAGIREYLPEKAQFYELDITDEAAVEKAIAEFKPEIINHHAAQVDVRVAVAEPKLDAQTNIFGSLNLIEAAIKNGVQKFIYANSGGAGYGDPDPRHIPCDEETPIRPISPYGVSKMTTERYLYARSKTHNLSYVALRYGNVYGPRQTFGEAGVVAIFTHLMLNNKPATIFGDGSQERDYAFVGDVVAANKLALEDKASGAYNIGTGVGTSTQTVFDEIKKATGYQQEPVYAPERPGEIQRIILNASHIKQELGWQPSVTFAEGVAKTVSWTRENKKA